MKHRWIFLLILMTLGATLVIQSCKNDSSSPRLNSGDSDSSAANPNPGVDPSSINSISSFSVVTDSGNVNGVISDSNNTISIILPSGTTNLSALIANFTTVAASVQIGTTPQVSGTTPNDFSKGAVTYTVTSQNGTARSYVVSVTIAPSATKEITAYTLNNIRAVVSIQGDITVQLPSGTSLNNLIAVFQTNGKSVQVGGVAQISGQTPNDFSAPVVYIVKAADGSSQKYTVRASVALNSSKDITSLGIANFPTVQAQRMGNNFSIILPYSTNTTNLNVAFQTTGVKVMYNGAPLQSGNSFVNFTMNPVIFTVYAADGTTQDFYVNVATQSVPATNDLLSFSMNGINANIVGNAVSLQLPYGSSLNNRVASFTTNGVSVKIGNTVQTPGQNINDFSGPVVYSVYAYDNTVKNYSVTVTTAPNPEKAFNSFSINSVNGVISQSSIQVNGIDCSADLTKLVPTFTYTGKTVFVIDPKGQQMVQYSNNGSINFTTPITYTVQALDGSTITYVVTVTKKTWVTQSYKDGKDTKYRQVCQ